MILNNSLKIAVVNSFRTTSLTDPIEILATEILLYKYLYSLLETGAVNSNDVQKLASTYKTQYEYTFSNLKNKYISYQKIYVFLKNKSTNNLLRLSDSDINTVYTLYKDSSQIVNFGTSTFNAKMYNISNLNKTEYNYLKNIHFNVMTPIIEYYNKIYGLPIENMKIVSSDSIPNNIGKRIEFTINDISPFIVLKDIQDKKINIKYYSISCKFPNIVILNE